MSREAAHVQAQALIAGDPAIAPIDVPAWLDREAYPFAPRRLRCDEGDLSYLDVGRGDPVLFVHGTPSWSFEWRKVIAALSSRRRCIAPDHLGFGLSDKPRDAALRPEDHARRLAHLIVALDLHRITLVLHDFGGPIGAQVALDLPDRVERIVVLNSWLWPNGDAPGMQRLNRVMHSSLGALLYRQLNFSPRVLLPAAFGERKRLTRAVHKQYLGPFAVRGSREAPYQLARELVGSDSFYAALWKRRGTLEPRVTDIVWGLADPALTPPYLDRMREAFPRARVHELQGIGHFVAEEAPEAVVDALS